VDNMHNINIERSILASFLFDSQQLALNSYKLSPLDFYLPGHQHIYEVMKELELEDKPIDEEFIHDKLVANQRWNEEVMLELLATNPLASVDAYIEELRTKTQQRDIQALSNEIRKKQSQGESTHEVLGFISQTCDDISDKNSTQKTKEMYEIVEEFESEFKEASEQKDYIGYKSGIAALDNIIGAFSPGDLVVVCARPSMGKTSFATTVTNYADKNSHGVLFDSLEMKSSQILRRLHSQRADESLSDIKRGLMKNPESFRKSLHELRTTKNIIIHDESYMSIHQLVAKASVIFRKNLHVKYWIIDHLRYIKKDGKNIPQEISEMTKMIKKVAKEYGIVVFLLSQLNRANEMRQNKRPILSDLRESGAVEEDAEIVLGLHRESYYNRSDPSIPEEPINAAEIIVMKNRDGKSGIAKCWFDGPHTSFTDTPAVIMHEYREDGLKMGFDL